MTMNLLLTETHQKCQDVLQSTTGEIVAPDYDKDGLYDLNIDCLWTVEAPEDYLIQFHIHSVDIESTIGCIKDFLKVVYIHELFCTLLQEETQYYT